MSRGMDSKIYKAAVDGNIDDLGTHWQGQLSEIRTIVGDSVLQVHLLNVKNRSANIDFVEALIEKDRSFLCISNDAEENSFHTAAWAGEHGALKLLLEKGGGDYATVVNKQGDTPLHIASRNANLGVVKELLCGNRGAGNNYQYTANQAGETPLHLAVENTCLEIIELIIEKIPASQPGHQSIGCALHAAASLKDLGILDKIMRLNPALIRFQDSKGQTPLHYAALNFWPEGIKHLLSVDSLAVYDCDGKGRTAAHIAAECNSVSVVKVLVEFHPDCCDVLDNKGQNVAHCAAEWGSGEVFKYFLEDSHFMNLIQKKDNGGNTPLHLFADAIPRLEADSVSYMQQDRVISLIRKHMEPVYYNKENLTPGDVAAKHVHILYELEPSKQDLFRKFMDVAPRSSRNKDLQENILISNKVARDDRMKKALTVKSRAKIYMTISLAFIAITVSCLLQICSSGMGKSNDNDTDSSNGDTSRLSIYAFQAFFIFILISLMVSVLASIFNAMVLIRNGRGFWTVAGSWAFFLAVIISPVFLLIAIMALLYATKRISGISSSIMGVTSGFFLLVCCVIVAVVFRFKRERSKLVNIPL